ncbi:ribonuclease T2 [Beijerinckia mobilis]|uniref:ribonuclease T2 n=1 Tax=Beijerinckia mobilis TaxID=231434 RepID=UPI000AA26475|nr:ribonuclease T2 [Beijerinckia mobilis]
MPDLARADGTPGDFDSYLFALSWSPTYCSSQAGQRRRSDSAQQCAPGRGLGFVVHGLWPQYDRGYPSACQPGAPAPSWSVLRDYGDLYPDTGLARHEWREHGTCSGKSPVAYFADVRSARDMIIIPEAFRNPGAGDKSWTANTIKRAFVDANPGLRNDMLMLACRGALLSEVRICFSRDLRRFQSCPPASSRGCRAFEISLPNPL